MRDRHSADHRPAVYRDGEHVVYRASALGGCIRSLVLARRGESPEPLPQAVLQVMAEGNLHETDILERVERELGGTVVRREVLVELHVGEGLLVRGHADAVLRTETGELVVVEAKAMSPERFRLWQTREGGWDGWERYAWQVGVYAAALGMPVVMAVKNRSSGQLVCERVEPRFTFWDIADRVRRIESLAKDEEWLPECEPDPFCRYTGWHDRPVGQQDLEKLVEERQRLRAQVYELSARLDSISAVILERMEADRVRVGQWTLSRCTRSTVDRERLEREHPREFQEHREHLERWKALEKRYSVPGKPYLVVRER